MENRPNREARSGWEGIKAEKGCLSPQCFKAILVGRGGFTTVTAVPTTSTFWEIWRQLNIGLQPAASQFNIA